jgi:GAF domain-containing protein
MPDSSAQPPLVAEVAARLTRDGTAPATLHSVLDQVLAHFGCTTGTLHSLDGPDLLHLRVHRGLPEALLPQVRVIPVGKGMAGLAAQRREPVQVCNLQSDTSGVAKPAARETRMEGCLAVPLLTDGALRGVLGIARPDAYTFSAAEVALLQETANTIGTFLGR